MYLNLGLLNLLMVGGYTREKRKRITFLDLYKAIRLFSLLNHFNPKLKYPFKNSLE